MFTLKNLTNEDVRSKKILKPMIWSPNHSASIKACRSQIGKDLTFPNIQNFGNTQNGIVLSPKARHRTCWQTFHYDVIIKWPVKWLLYSDVTIEWRQKVHIESHMSWICRKGNYQLLVKMEGLFFLKKKMYICEILCPGSNKVRKKLF